MTDLGFLSPKGGAGRRLLRALAILLLGWMALEIALAQLLANTFGWGPTIALHTIKGGAGLVLLGLAGVSLWTCFRSKPSRLSVHSLSQFAFPLASAILITLPGLIPTLLGIALFSPSLRLKLLAILRPLRRQTRP